MLNKKRIYILFCFILIFLYNKFLYINIKDISIGYHKIEINKSYNNIKIIKFDGKNIDKDAILQNIYLDDGRYVIVYDLKKISNKNFNGKVISYKEKIFSKINKKIFNNIDKNFTPSLLGFMKSSLLGNRSLLDKKLKNNLKYLNLYHILAISSLHISIIFNIIKKSLSYFEINEKAIIFTSYIILLAYGAIIGNSPSILRIIIFETLLLINFDLDIKLRYLISFFLLVFVDYNNIFDASFIFSFVSIYAIIFVYSNFEKKIENKFLKLITFNILIQIYMMPFMYINTLSIPIYSFLINLFMLPIFVILINLVFLVFVLNFFNITFFNVILELYYYTTYYILTFFSKLKYVSVEVKEVKIIILMTMVLLIILIEIFQNIYLKLDSN